jgi:hypothetical protein
MGGLMPRQSLSDLLGNLNGKPDEAIAKDEVGASKGIKAIAPPVASDPVKPTVRQPEPLRLPIDEGELPVYLRFVRKETRLREEQQNELTVHARRLNRTRPSGTPRITDNTLIRISVDLLLGQINDLDGGDEAAILAQLSRAARE